jgi:hypothetical protein
MNCLINFFTDRCHTKKDFRLFSTQQVMKKAESTKRKAFPVPVFFWIVYGSSEALKFSGNLFIAFSLRELDLLFPLHITPKIVIVDNHYMIFLTVT